MLTIALREFGISRIVLLLAVIGAALIFGCAMWIADAEACCDPPLPACIVPTALAPSGTVTISGDTGMVTLSWRPSQGAIRYNVRLDDGSGERYDDPRFTSCADSSSYYCETNIAASQITGVPVKAGRTYSFVVEPIFSPARAYCNGSTQFTVVTTGTTAPLSCSPAVQTVGLNQAASFVASGGNGTFTWSGGGTPTNGAGSNFSTSFNTAGSKTVTVASGSQTANCVVNVTPAPITLACSPLFQSAAPGQNVTLSATGGTGNFSWSAPNGDPSSGGGASFSTRYSAVGLMTVTATSGGQTASCAVNVQSGTTPVTPIIPPTPTPLLPPAAPLPPALVLGAGPFVPGAPTAPIPSPPPTPAAPPPPAVSFAGYYAPPMVPIASPPPLLAQPPGQVLGVADIVTGASDMFYWIFGMGFLFSLALYYAVFRLELIPAFARTGIAATYESIVAELRRKENGPDTNSAHLKT